MPVHSLKPLTQPGRLAETSGGIMWLPTIKWDTWSKRRPLKCLPVTEIKSMHHVDAVQNLLALLQNGKWESEGKPMPRSDFYKGLQGSSLRSYQVDKDHETCNS